MSTTVPVLSTAHQSKWGFHPVNREDFLILKYLRKRYWAAFFMANRWARWGRKQPQNRRGPAPPLDPQIHDLKQAARFLATVKNGYLHGYYITHVFKDVEILEDWQNARMPKATAEEVVPFDMEPYRELHAKLVQ